MVAPLWGDRAKGNDHGWLLKIPGGFKAGGHSHTAAYHAVAIQGGWIHTNDATEKGRDYPAGSYVYQPGKAVHNDICKGPGECIVFVHQHGPNDFIPAKTP
jgi:anti-sigma factor ChrR (cupin superfamily)